VTDVTDTGGSPGRGRPKARPDEPPAGPDGPEVTPDGPEASPDGPEASPETPASPARLLPARESAGKPAAHLAAIADLQAAYAAIPPGSPVRLAKRTSNLFRFTDGKGAHRGAGYGSGPGHGDEAGEGAAGYGGGAGHDGEADHRGGAVRGDGAGDGGGDGHGGDVGHRGGAVRGDGAGDGGGAGHGGGAARGGEVGHRSGAVRGDGAGGGDGAGHRRGIGYGSRASHRIRAGHGSGAASRGLDVSAFGRVLSVDPRSRIAVTGGMTTYEDLADATLRHDLMPLVVPQLKTITIGGAVTGLGIESSSLRSGMPHESVLEMEILTGDGRVITAAPGGEHDALYRGFPNSYGTLGYALSLTIELEPVKPFVHLRHFRFGSPEACMDAVAAIAADGSYLGHRADFVDGTAFGLDELYLTVGSFSDVAPWRSDYTRERIYYQSIRGPQEDFLTIRDYLWRWDTDWFWCSRPFGVQRPVIRRLWPRRYRRSDVYRKLVALDRRHGLSAALNARRGVPQHEDVIQDVEIPVERGAEFLRAFAAGVGMSPVWMCPLRLRGAGPGGGLPGPARGAGPGGRPPGPPHGAGLGGGLPGAARGAGPGAWPPGTRADPPWPLYPLEPDRVYVNFGFWGTVPLPPGKADGYHNRLVEETVTGLGGHKGLYSTSCYPEEEFWTLYNGSAYAALKAEYDPAGRLAGLYEKCVRGR